MQTSAQSSRAVARFQPPPDDQKAAIRSAPQPQPRAAVLINRRPRPQLTHGASDARRLALFRIVCQAGNGGNGGIEIGAEMLAGRADARANMHWRDAIVVENRPASADGGIRTLVLSVDDPIEFLEGRRRPRYQADPRWIDAYQVPGQFVGVRLGSRADAAAETVNGAAPADAAPGSGNTAAPDAGGNAAAALLPIASSPIAARADSSLIDASIIEVLVERQARGGGATGSAQLMGLGPGSQLQVSDILGRGYSSLLNSVVGLTSALEESRALLLIGAGARGIAPLRAALEWPPVQAAATQRAVSLFYAAPSMQAAAYVPDWDTWRENGVAVQPVFLDQLAEQGDCSTALADAIVDAVFVDGGLATALAGGAPSESAVLLGGLPGEVVATLSRRLVMEGVARERVLFCDFF